ncbi:MAG: hypothetical protein NVSMB1_00340 [Polyangiales bacterium]
MLGASPLGACGARTGLLCEVDFKIANLPNLYFVLDRSGSMRIGNKWNTVRSQVGALMSKMGNRARFGASVFPSINRTECGPGDEVMPLQAGNSADAGVSLADRFMAATNIAPFGGTPTAATLNALAPKFRSFVGPTFAVLATDGGPNCNPDLSCAVDRCTDNMDRVDPRCQPNRAPNCCAADIGGGKGCLDEDGVIAAVRALASNGVPTFVIGIPGSAPYAAVLERVAEVGGTARPSPPAYYRVDSFDAEALSSALNDIATEVAKACVVQIDVPYDASVTAVFVGGKRVVDSEWSLLGSTLGLRGRACASLLVGEELRVHGGRVCAPTHPNHGSIR